MKQLVDDLRSLLRQIESQGELTRIRDEVSPRFDVSRIMNENDGKALLFENVNGHSTCIASGLFGTKQRLSRALGRTEAQLYSTITKAISNPLE